MHFVCHPKLSRKEPCNFNILAKTDLIGQCRRRNELLETCKNFRHSHHSGHSKTMNCALRVALPTPRLRGICRLASMPGVTSRNQDPSSKDGAPIREKN